MSFLVVNCFHWIGFHLVNYLLENGNQVVGVDHVNSDKKKHFYMLIGRNASFEFVTSSDDIDYDISIKVDDVFESTVSSKNIIRIGFNTKKEREGELIDIKLPILFGEWMPMSEKGIIYNDRMVPFESEEFLTEAVYINDFTKAFGQLILPGKIPSTLTICSENSRKSEGKSLENCIYIRDNRPIEEKVEGLISHYKQYKHIYDFL